MRLKDLAMDTFEITIGWVLTIGSRTSAARAANEPLPALPDFVFE